MDLSIYNLHGVIAHFIVDINQTSTQTTYEYTNQLNL